MGWTDSDFSRTVQMKLIMLLTAFITFPIHEAKHKFSMQENEKTEQMQAWGFAQNILVSSLMFFFNLSLSHFNKFAFTSSYVTGRLEECS